MNIGKIAVNVKASLDYNKKPCQATLDHLSIDKLSGLDVRMTGLGFLNSIVATVVEGLIKSKALASLRDIIIPKLRELECEKFRPT